MHKLKCRVDECFHRCLIGTSSNDSRKTTCYPCAPANSPDTPRRSARLSTKWPVTKAHTLDSGRSVSAGPRMFRKKRKAKPVRPSSLNVRPVYGSTGFMGRHSPDSPESEQMEQLETSAVETARESDMETTEDADTAAAAVNASTDDTDTDDTDTASERKELSTSPGPSSPRKLRSRRQDPSKSPGDSHKKSYRR